MLERLRFIVVEGPIGAGKTTLARRIAERLGADTLFEDASANPFLPKFYKDMRRNALPTQLFFLFQRAEQLAALRQPGLFPAITVSDYMLEKDPIFARLTLADDEFALYAKVFAHLRIDAPRPDLVIYLQASIGTLLDRIERRGLKMERAIPEDYLRSLSESYSRFFYQYDESPLLIVNSDHLNFVDEPEHFELFMQQLARQRGGREFFNVG